MHNVKRAVGYSLIALLAVIMFAVPKSAQATSLDTSGAVQNEYQYEEAVFISGKPVIFKGEGKNIKITEKKGKDTATRTYNVKLTGPQGASLTRNITYTSDIVNYDVIGQQTSDGKVTKFSEKIVIGGVTYTLVEYQHSESTLTDVRPASDYYSGIATSRKIYSKTTRKNQPSERVYVDVRSRHAGYENFWGATETKINNYVLTPEIGGVMQENDVATVDNYQSVRKSRKLQYEENMASGASFTGQYIVENNKNMISSYEYDIPYDAGVGSVDLNLEYMPTNEALPTAKYHDIAGIDNEARNAIEKLYGLQTLYTNTQNFNPGASITREEFVVALVKLLDMRVEMQGEKPKKAKGKNEASIFKDVPRSNPNYEAISTAVARGLINVQNGYFEPNAPLRRSQVSSYLVRALGLENKKPNLEAVNHYEDEGNFSSHYSNIYIANELGLMTGFPDTNTFKAYEPLKKAQAARIMDRLLNYLDDDLEQNYRDDIIFNH